MQNVTEKFQEIVWNYLLGLADKDESFQEKLYRNDKSIEECCSYIVGEVKKSGRFGFSDEEVFSMATHYFIENDIKVEGSLESVRVIVNEKIENNQTKKKTINNDEDRGQLEQPSLFSDKDYEI